MGEKELANWSSRSRNSEIIRAFFLPKTPTQIQKELNIKKFNLKPFLKRDLLKCLNPEAQKGRLYTLTDRSRRLLNLQESGNRNRKNYGMIGWVISSPMQRLVVLKTLSRDSMKRTSEDIRKRSSNLNPCLSRISTKSILKDLISKELVDSELGEDRRRYYWLTEKGWLIAREFQ